MTWQPIDTAPHDRPIMLVAGGMEFRAEWTCGFEDENGMTCTWAAVDEGKHPESWDEGVCWSINAALVPSEQPEAWRDD